MCGIVGYIGKRSALPILLNGLARLEYRGYDSAGVAVLSDGKLKVHKQAGRLEGLARSLEGKPLDGTRGIGHTRWATHGRPTAANAHPHLDCSGEIAVVHNGIIENFLALRRELEAKGHRFRSETDTEIVAHLVEEACRGDLVKAVRAAVSRLEGQYALAIIHAKEPDKVVAVKHLSPLIVGLGEGENFIASDIPAILEETAKVHILEDGEMCVVREDRTELFKLDGKPVSREHFAVPWDPETARKAGYKHFMLKEIHEQPEALQRAVGGRILERPLRVELPELRLTAQRARRLKKVIIVACGTAYHAGLVGKFLLENWAKIPTEADLASEFRYRNPILEPNSLCLIITQSGETADTLAGMRLAKGEGIPVASVVNVVGSTAAREADYTLYMYCGPEIGVASTKAYTGQVIVQCLLALKLAELRGTLSPRRIRALTKGIQELPALCKQYLADTQEVESLGRQFSVYPHFLYLGRGANLASAHEGALKLKEISYIHAEGYAAGEMKHGPIALIDEKFPTMAVAVEGEVYEKVLNNLQEIRARDGTILAVAFEGDENIKNYADHVLPIPRCEESLSPVVVALPLQLFAYYAADERGCDIDKPRNLAKSVTVE